MLYVVIGKLKGLCKFLVNLKGLKAPKRCFHHLYLIQCSTGEDIAGTKCLINEALIRGGIPNMVSYSAMVLMIVRLVRLTELSFECKEEDLGQHT